MWKKLFLKGYLSSKIVDTGTWKDQVLIVSVCGM